MIYLQLSTELEKILKFGDFIEAGEVSKLRGEVRDLGAVNLSLEKYVESLTKENNISVDRIFKLLSEKSDLIIECDSLKFTVKDLIAEVCDLKAALSTSKEELFANANTWNADKADLIAKLDDTGYQLARCRVESLKSFEEGYGECVAHFFGVGVDVKGQTFECYLADLQSKVTAGELDLLVIPKEFSLFNLAWGVP